MRVQTTGLDAENQVSQKILRALVAKLNSGGGEIPVPSGTTDDRASRALGTILMKKATRQVRPDTSTCVHIEVRKDGHAWIIVEDGPRKPYYISVKGMRPEGVFVCRGSREVPASMQMIRDMIRDTYGDEYEEMRSLRQDLTFHEAQATFFKSGKELTEKEYAPLGITCEEDGMFTNLGLMLSDQCAHTVRICEFEDDKNTKLADVTTITCSVCRELEMTAVRLDRLNHSRTVTENGRMRRQWDYPGEALKEALLNALAHRDYSFSGAIVINANPTSIQFLSVGGLMSDLSVEDVRSGVSEPRNRRLSQIFRRLSIMGPSALGIRRVFSLYSGAAEQPVIQVTPHSFSITLPILRKEAVPEPASAARQPLDSFSTGEEPQQEGRGYWDAPIVADDASYGPAAARDGKQRQLDYERSEMHRNQHGYAMRTQAVPDIRAVGSRALRAYRKQAPTRLA